MTFLHPTLAAVGLACVALPVIIHILLRRRRKPMQWGAMRFVLEAVRRRRRRTMFEQILLLLLRCLVVAMLAMGIGAASCSGADDRAGAGATTTWYLLDNSLTSRVPGADGRAEFDALLDAARRDLDARSGAGERAGVILLGAGAQPLVSPPSPDLGVVRNALALATPTDGRADLAGALLEIERRISADSAAGPARIVLLSGWRAGAFDLESPLPRIDTTGVRLLASPPAPQPTLANTTIVGLAPRRAVAVPGVGSGDGPEGLGPISVVVRRAGPGLDARASVGVVVEIDQRGVVLGRSAGEVIFAPGEREATATVRVRTSGEARGPAIITARLDADLIPADSVARAAVEFRPLRVGIIDDGRRGTAAQRSPASFVRAALEPEFSARAGLGIELVEIDPSAVFPERLAGLDAVIAPNAGVLDDGALNAIAGFVRSGGLVVAAPSPALDAAQLWPMILSDALDLGVTIDPEPIEPELPGLDPAPPGSLLRVLGPQWRELVPSVGIARSLAIRVDPGREDDVQILASAASGEPFVITQAVGDSGGRVVLLASAIDREWSSLPLSPVFVPVIQETLRQGMNPLSSAALLTLGENPTRTGARRLMSAEPGVEPIDFADGVATSPVRRIGLYRDTAPAQIPAQPAGQSTGQDQSGLPIGATAERIAIVNPDPLAGDPTPLTRDQLMAHLSTMDPALASGSPAPITWLDAGAESLAREDRDRDGAQAGSLSLTFLAIAAGLALLELGGARLTSYRRNEPAQKGGRE